MSDPFSRLEQTNSGTGPAAAIDELVALLRERKDYFRLFDALLLKKKFAMGLPVGQPTGFDDVPKEQQAEFEESYIDAAREVGTLLLEDGDIARAWPYFRTIRETQPVRDAIESISVSREPSEETEALVGLAIYEGANPAKGFEILLRTHGTCNTITALDQQLHQMPTADQQRVVSLLVKEIHSDLLETLRREVEQRIPMLPPTDSLVELCAGRDWLFEGGNYHVDVSHLNAVVRFARSLEAGRPELKPAIELAQYGSRLDSQFQYPGDPPFEDFYPAHAHFLQALAGVKVDEAVAYFRDKLANEPDEPDQQLIAYVLVDLLTRIDRKEDAFAVAEQHLRNVDEGTGFSFARFCREHEKLEVLRDYAREKGDLVTYLTTLVR